ncbi:hypothetical protein CcI49_11230 [Frankia sp. CcI49]|uniref:hypothetical protein n=1 Tax=Frankia sp. CcI49 TaxID=1745382 RepID=UPI0009CDD30A|nr:hypothetical protein [Frankia sp. CcI49]ONH60614.1 hypothetical protein CcI49_11230 [Frankia sp. CcI49]
MCLTWHRGGRAAGKGGAQPAAARSVVRATSWTTWRRASKAGGGGAIVAALDAPAAPAAPAAPLHLALGTDAVESIRAAQDRRRADLDSWEAVSHSTDVDAAPA